MARRLPCELPRPCCFGPVSPPSESTRCRMSLHLAPKTRVAESGRGRAATGLPHPCQRRFGRCGDADGVAPRSEDVGVDDRAALRWVEGAEGHGASAPWSCITRKRCVGLAIALWCADLLESHWKMSRGTLSIRLCSFPGTGRSTAYQAICLLGLGPGSLGNWCCSFCRGAADGFGTILSGATNM